MKHLIRTFGALALFSVASSHALAQESQIHDYGTGFVNEAAEIDKVFKSLSMQSRGEVEPKEVQVSIVQEDYMEDGDQFALRLMVPEAVTGCYKISPLDYEASFIDPYYLDIKVNFYRVDQIETDAPHIECEKGYKVSSASVPLSVKDLRARGTRQIKFRTKNVTEYYDLSLQDNQVLLRPQSMRIFKAAIDSRSGVLAHDMAAPSKLHLYVPAAGENDDLSDQLATFAQAKGLAVGSDAATQSNNMILVRDDRGNLVDELRGAQVKEMGTLYVERQYRGENGLGQTKVPLTVFAKRP